MCMSNCNGISFINSLSAQLTTCWGKPIADCQLGCTHASSLQDSASKLSAWLQMLSKDAHCCLCCWEMMFSVNNATHCILLNTHKSSDWWAVNIGTVFTCAEQHNKHNCWALAAWGADWDMSSYKIITYWSYGDTNKPCDWGAVPPQHMCTALDLRWWTGLHAWVESCARKAWCFRRICVAVVYVMCQICHFQFTCQSSLTGIDCCVFLIFGQLKHKA